MSTLLEAQGKKKKKSSLLRQKQGKKKSREREILFFKLPKEKKMEIKIEFYQKEWVLNSPLN